MLNTGMAAVPVARAEGVEQPRIGSRLARRDAKGTHIGAVMGNDDSDGSRWVRPDLMVACVSRQEPLIASRKVLDDRSDSGAISLVRRTDTSS